MANCYLRLESEGCDFLKGSFDFCEVVVRALARNWIFEKINYILMNVFVGNAYTNISCSLVSWNC